MDRKPSTEYYTNISPFMNKFLVRGLNPFSFQKYFIRDKKFGYYPEERRITQDDFYRHFFSGGKKFDTYILGSLAIVPVVNNEIKFVCFDIDNKKQKDEWLSKVPPELSKLGLDYIIGHGSSTKVQGSLNPSTLDRAHIYIPMNCSVETARHLIFQIGETVDLNFHNPADKDTWFGEIYGVNKLKNLIRVDGGFHYTKGAYFPVELKDGSLSDKPEDFMRLFLQSRQPSEEELKPLLKPLTIVAQKEEVKKKSIVERISLGIFPGT